MTAQVTDTVTFQGNRYSIAGIKGEGLFTPQEYDIEPVMASSACWRGYVCEYVVLEELLRLQTLYIGLDMKGNLKTKSGRGNELWGIKPKSHDGVFKGVKYEGIGRPVPFTGGLLLGAKLVSGLSVNMGFQSAYKFRELYEFSFEHGQLVIVEDLSERAADYRRKTEGVPLKPGSDNNIDTTQWIKECFSLDYQSPF